MKNTYDDRIKRSFAICGFIATPLWEIRNVCRFQDDNTETEKLWSSAEKTNDPVF